MTAQEQFLNIIEPLKKDANYEFIASRWKFIKETIREKMKEQREIDQNHYYMKHGFEEDYDENYMNTAPEPEL